MKQIVIFTVLAALLTSQATVFADRPDARKRAIMEKLRTTRVSMDFTDAPIKDVVSFLQAVSGINLLLDPAVLRERSEEELRVTLTVKKITLKNALALVSQFFKLHTDYRNGVLVLTTKKRAGDMKVVVYDVRDMMMQIRDFKGPDIKLASGPQPGVAIDFGGGDETDKAIDKDTLLELLKDNTGDVWGDDYPKSGISMIGGLLVVNHNGEVQGKVRRLLSMMRYYR